MVPSGRRRDCLGRTALHPRRRGGALRRHSLPRHLASVCAPGTSPGEDDPSAHESELDGIEQAFPRPSSEPARAWLDVRPS